MQIYHLDLESSFNSPADPERLYFRLSQAFLGATRGVRFHTLTIPSTHKLISDTYNKVSMCNPTKVLSQKTSPWHTTRKCLMASTFASFPSRNNCIVRQKSLPLSKYFSQQQQRCMTDNVMQSRQVAH